MSLFRLVSQLMAHGYIDAQQVDICPVVAKVDVKTVQLTQELIDMSYLKKDAKKKGRKTENKEEAEEEEEEEEEEDKRKSRDTARSGLKEIPLPWWYLNQCQLWSNCQAQRRQQAPRIWLEGEHPSNPVLVSDDEEGDVVQLEGKHPSNPIVISDDEMVEGEHPSHPIVISDDEPEEEEEDPQPPVITPPPSPEYGGDSDFESEEIAKSLQSLVDQADPQQHGAWISNMLKSVNFVIHHAIEKYNTVPTEEIEFLWSPPLSLWHDTAHGIPASIHELRLTPSQDWKKNCVQTITELKDTDQPWVEITDMKLFISVVDGPLAGTSDGKGQYCLNVSEELPANSPPQAKILRKNRYVFNFFIQTLILI
jgi:hypothetical protein